MAAPLYRHPTRSEIIELAAAEGHDADIPTNAGYISSPPFAQSPLSTTSNPSANDIEKDIEKTAARTSLSSAVDTANDAQSTHNDEDNDPNVVTWDGPDDPQNPMNWSFTRKWGTICIVSCITFLTPLASSMFAPGVPAVMETFNSTDTMLQGFMISIYVLGFAFGPLVFAPLSEMYGRLPVYHTCNVCFIAFTVGAGLATNMTAFIALRFFMGCFGGCPLVLGGGTIADLIRREQRGTAMVVWMMGPTIGPCVGPIIGGFLTEAKGWRWNFWLVAILAGAFTAASMLLMSETSAPVILERKTRLLRKETGNPALHSKLDSGVSAKELFKRSIFRPTKLLFFAPICTVISIYCAYTYCLLYIFFTTVSPVFADQYGWDGGILGLSFLGMGVGSLIGMFVFTHFDRRIANKHTALGDFQAEHRLGLMCIGGFFIPVGLLWYGWAAEYKTHYMLPMVGTGVMGFGLIMTFMPASTYLVDCFTVTAASAMAASTVLRSLTAALVPLSSQAMYARLKYGWGNSLLAFLSLALVPVPFALIRWGRKIRERTKVRL